MAKSKPDKNIIPENIDNFQYAVSLNSVGPLNISIELVNLPDENKFNKNAIPTTIPPKMPYRTKPILLTDYFLTI